MGKYRIGLVLISFLLTYFDVYVNKVETAYFVSSTTFFAMLLYDYEKLKRQSKTKLTKNFANLGATVYTALLFLFLFLFVLAQAKYVKFVESNGSILFKMKIKILHYNGFDFFYIFITLSLITLGVTLVEVFIESEEDSVVDSSGVAMGK